MEQLVVEGEGLASSTALLNASAQMERKITRRDAQTFLKSLVRDKWLSEVVGGTASRLFQIGITDVYMCPHCSPRECMEQALALFLSCDHS